MRDDLFSEKGDPLRVSWQDCSQDEMPGDPFLAAVDQETLTLALSALRNPIIGQKGARYERVIRLSFGLYEGPALSLAEIGAEMGIGRERVRAIQQHALRIMRHKLCRVETTGSFLLRFGPDLEAKPIASSQKEQAKESRKKRLEQVGPRPTQNRTAKPLPERRNTNRHDVPQRPMPTWAIPPERQGYFVHQSADKPRTVEEWDEKLRRAEFRSKVFCTLVLAALVFGLIALKEALAPGF